MIRTQSKQNQHNFCLTSTNLPSLQCYILIELLHHCKKELFSSKNMVAPMHVYATAWEGEKGMIYTELYMFHTALSVQ